MTHNPSTSACVESDPSFVRSSSEMVPPEAGPMAIVRRAMELLPPRREDATAVARRKVDESMAAMTRVYESETIQGGKGKVWPYPWYPPARHIQVGSAVTAPSAQHCRAQLVLPTVGDYVGILDQCFCTMAMMYLKMHSVHIF
jgi:hypothetical protein